MLSDRSFAVPRNMREIETVTCPRLKDAADNLKDVFKSCLRPFPKTIAGLAIRGARMTMKEKCASLKDKEFIIRHLACVQDQTRLDLLHDVLDDYGNKLLYMQNSIPPERMLGSCCCVYGEARKDIRDIASKYCALDGVAYAEKLIDDMLQDALDLACSAYLDEPQKCIQIKDQDPIPQSFNSTTRSKNSFLLTLIDLLTLVAD